MGLMQHSSLHQSRCLPSQRPCSGGLAARWPVAGRRRQASSTVQSNPMLDTYQAAPLVLEDIRVVLVAPKGVQNIGAVCRAAANFEAPDLFLVAPRCDPSDPQVLTVACGESVYARMRVVGSLEEALSGTTSSVGFTRRAGATRFTHPSITAMLAAFPDAISAVRPDNQPPAPSGGVTALVFGREESGLTEGELRLCAHACALPTGRLQPSMNLSHATALVLGQLYERRCEMRGLQDLGLERAGAAPSPAVLDGLQPVTVAELDALLAKVARIARAVGVSSEEAQGGGPKGNHGRRRLPLGHIRAILGRARANTWEVRSLHGLASATLKQLGLPDKEPGQGSPGGDGSRADSKGSDAGQQGGAPLTQQQQQMLGG